MKKILLLVAILSFGTAFGQSMLGGGVVFSEVMPNLSGDPDEFDTDSDMEVEAEDEFVEIYNLSAADIDISDWELWDPGSNNYFTFPSSTTLKAGAHAFVVMGTDGDGTLPTVSGNNLAFSAGRSSGVMNNTSDNLVLYDPVEDEYIQAKYNGDSDDDPTNSTDTDYDDFSGTATRSGSIEDFGSITPGNSSARTPTGGTSFDLNKNVCSCSDLASPGSSSLSTITWDGSEGSDWSDADNWDGGVVPTNSDNVIIANAGTVPIIASGTEAACNDLTINASASLKVASGGSLAIFGTATNSGTYTVEKAVTGGTGTANSAGYSILGSPVDDATIDDLSADFVFSYASGDGFSSNRNTATSTMDPGVGYFVGFDAISPTVSITGNPNSGDVSYVSEVTGFELVANPYAAAIDVEDFLSDNTLITGGVYLWDDGGSNVGSNRGGDYISVTAMGAASSVEPNGTSDGVAGSSSATPASDGYIASVQGFFVELSEDGAVTFSPNHQVFADGSNDESDHYRTAPFQKVKLAIEGNGLYNEVLVGLGEGATYGVDRIYDAKKFVTDNPLSFYSLMNDEKYVIQALPLARTEDVHTKLGFDLAEAGDFTLRVVSIENVPEALEVSIIDHATDQEFTLDENTTLEFSTEIVQGDQRFELVFRQSSTLSIEEDLTPSMMVYGNRTAINIQADVEARSQVMIHTLDGKVLFNQEVTFVDHQASISPALESNQLYILRVNDSSLKFLIK